MRAALRFTLFFLPALLGCLAFSLPNHALGAEISKPGVATFSAWDDRFEAPPLKPLFPALAAGEVPSYDVHIAPIVKRYCVSCHRAGKENNDFLMTSYEEILSTGKNKDNIISW